MKKRPIYLYIFLILSSIFTVLDFFGTFLSAGRVDRAAIEQSFKQVSSNVSADYVDKMIDYSQKGLDFSVNIPHKILVVLAIVLLGFAIFFFVKKQILQTNLAYVAYVLLAIVGLTYNYIGGRALVTSSGIDASIKELTFMTLNVTYIIALLINIFFLALTFFKIWRQQKALEVEEAKAAENI